MAQPSRNTTGKAPGRRLGLSVPALVVVACVFAVTGVGHRLLLAQIDAAVRQSLVLERPLASLSLQLGPWQGRDVPMDERTRQIAGDDDSINRVYRHADGDRSISLYVGYVGRPRARMGHRADVCYPAHGFRETSRERTSVPGPGGETVPATLFEFQSADLGGPRDLVLTTFVVNGQYTSDPSKANEYNVRTPGLLAKRAAYVARIQISIRGSGNRADDVAPLTAFASQLLEPVRGMMPRSGDAR